MAIERVGYRRLYDAMGCSLSDHQESYSEFSMGAGRGGSVYLGPRPKFGIVVVSGCDKYLIPDEQSLLGHFEYNKDATNSSYPRKFFMEVFCWKDIVVSLELSERFHAKQPGADDELLKLAEQEAKEFTGVADLISGTIGLRLHRQFVIKPINENFLAQRANEDWPIRITGPSIETLDKVSIRPSGLNVLKSLLEEIGKADPEARELPSLAMSWLLRAWSERDTVSKFMSLFIPLEVILEGYGNSPQDELREQAEALRELIRDYGGEHRKELLELVNSLMERQRPSLQTRFEELAAKARLSGWEGDVVAFKQFNKIRNSLLHRGEHRVRIVVSVGETEIRQLEDIVERYICYSFFADDQGIQAVGVKDSHRGRDRHHSETNPFIKVDFCWIILNLALAIRLVQREYSLSGGVSANSA